MTAAPYARREDVTRALDTRETARAARQVDRLLDSSSRSIEGFLHRTFTPTLATRSFSASYRRHVWLNDDELISASQVTVGGTALPPGSYTLWPSQGPYARLDRDSELFSDTVAITGLFGYTDDQIAAGSVVTSVNSSVTTLDVSDGSLIGVGDLLRIDSERLLVTDRGALTTTATLSGDLTAVANATAVPVSSGALVFRDEVVTVDTERMLVVDIIGNTLQVLRGWDGTTLAAHSNAAMVYAQRRLTVQRGAAGTTAASHTSTTAITRWEVPSLVRQLCIAETLNAVQQESSGYARVSGEGDYARETSGRGLVDLRRRALSQLGRIRKEVV